MDREVVWTEAAWRDLDEAADYIARDSPAYASSWVEAVRNAARSLSHHPLRGRKVPEIDDPSVREIFVTRYRLVYRVVPERVYILGLIHGARDFTRAWARRRRKS